jgi:hypothetical protein
MARKKRKLTKTQLKKLRQRIARKNFGIRRTKRKSRVRNKFTPLRRMARRRRTKTKKRYSRKGKFGGAMKYLAAGLYGALRARTSNALSPITQKIPLGDVADEAGMFAANWAVGKFVKAARPVTQAGMLIEAARIGEAVATGSIFGASNNGVGLGMPTIG